MHELRDPRLDYVLGRAAGAAPPGRVRSTCSSAPTPHDAEVRRVLRDDGTARPPA